MSKQDRQGVRTPSDIERKYDLGKLNAFRGDSQKQDIMLTELTQKVDQFIANTNGNFESINVKVDDINADIDDINKDINNINNSVSGFNGTINELSDKYTALDSKVAELEEELNNSQGGGNSEDVAWENVCNKPETFPPSEHSHTASQIGAMELLTKTITATTNANGNIDLTGLSASYIPLALRCSGSYIATPYYSYTNNVGVWKAHIQTASDNSNIASKSVTVIVYYVAI